MFKGFMRAVAALLAVFCVVIYVPKASAEVTVKKQSFGGGGTDYFNSAAIAEDGYVTVGATYKFGSGDWSDTEEKGYYDAVIVKYDADDNIEWKYNFGGSASDYFEDVAADESGYVAVGYSDSGSFKNGDWSGIKGKSGTDAIIVKFDPDGDILWKKPFGGSDGDYFYGVTAAEDGYVAVGYSGRTSFNNGDWSGSTRNGASNAIIVKYDLDGNVEWKQRFGGSSNGCEDRFCDVAAVEGGYVAVGYATGNSFGSGDWSEIAAIGGKTVFDEDAIIVKFDLDGNVEWKRNFGGEDEDEFKGVAQAAEGYVAVGYSYSGSFANGDWGETEGKGAEDAIIVKFDAEGNAVWQQNFGGESKDEFFGVAAAKDGYIAVGDSKIESFGSGDWSETEGYGDYDAILVKYDEDGNIEMKQKFGGEGDEQFSAAAVEDNRYIVVGDSYYNSFGNGDWSDIEGKGSYDSIVVQYLFETTSVRFTEAASAEVYAEKAGEYVLIFAAYDESGSLAGVERQEITFTEEGRTEYAPQTLDIGAAKTMRAMLWKNDGSMEPLCDAAKMTL